MDSTTKNPLGKGIHSANSITFAGGIGVTNQVSAQLTWAQVIEFSKNPQCVEKKNASWILPNNSPVRRRPNTEHSEFGLLWADIDQPPSGGLDEVVSALNSATPYLAYTTKSATVGAQRCRLVVPLVEPLDFNSWFYYQSKLNSVLGNAGIKFDSCNLNPAQILFLPNRGEYYDYRYREGFYNAKAMQQDDTVDQPTLKPCQSGKGGVIGRFNLAFSVADILTQAGYAQNPSNPLQWRHPRSESGSYSASINPDTGRIHSLSSCDPLYTGGGGIGAHDAFSAFTVLFCNGRLNLAVARAANEWLKEVAA